MLAKVYFQDRCRYYEDFLLNVRDFDHLQSIWDSISKNDKDAHIIAENLGYELKSKLYLPISILDQEASEFFKMVHVDYTRIGVNVLEKE